jgi:hypothetical protein
LLTTSQEQASQLPSRLSPVPYNTSIQTSITALIIAGALATTVVSVIGLKQYQRYRFRQNIQMLERVWQQPDRKRIR